MIYLLLFITILKININESLKNKFEKEILISAVENMNLTRGLRVRDAERSSTLESSTPEVCTFFIYFPCDFSCEVTANDRVILNNWLENHKKLCESPMTIRFFESTFPDNTFSEADLTGDFLIKRLVLNLEELHNINDNAFDKPSMRELESLEIRSKSQFGVETMNEKTFFGLHSLKYFQMSNGQGLKELSADFMFKPLASTICEILFTQRFYEGSKGYDPGNWLKGANFSKLVDFSCISCYLPSTLNANSFSSLINVEDLVLIYCNITVLQDDTFEPIIKTLKHLNLSFNQLIRLSSELVFSLKGVSRSLYLEENQWKCDCENEHLINAIKNKELKLYDHPVCETPDSVNGKNLGDIKLNCDSYTTSSITTYSTTRPTTEITKISPTTETTIIIETSTKDESYETDDEHEIKLICKFADGEDVITKIKQQLMFFSITSNSEESVTLTFERKAVNIFLFYFTPEVIESGKSLKLEDEILSITELLAAETYIFCLTPNDENDLISPFDCRSHHMIEQNFYKKRKAWLTSNDKLIFILLSIFGALISLSIGISSIFCLLRQRAALRSSKTILDKETISSDEVYEAPSNFYLKYYQRSQIPATKITTINDVEYLPPENRAPALPPFEEFRLQSINPEINHIYDSIYPKNKNTTNNYLEHYQRSINTEFDVNKTKDVKVSSPTENAPETPSLLKSNQLITKAEIHHDDGEKKLNDS